MSSGEGRIRYTWLDTPSAQQASLDTSSIAVGSTASGNGTRSFPGRRPTTAVFAIVHSRCKDATGTATPSEINTRDANGARYRQLPPPSTSPASTLPIPRGRRFYRHNPYSGQQLLNGARPHCFHQTNGGCKSTERSSSSRRRLGRGGRTLTACQPGLRHSFRSSAATQLSYADNSGPSNPFIEVPLRSCCNFNANDLGGSLSDAAPALEVDDTQPEDTNDSTQSFVQLHDTESRALYGASDNMCSARSSTSALRRDASSTNASMDYTCDTKQSLVASILSTSLNEEGCAEAVRGDSLPAPTDHIPSVRVHTREPRDMLCPNDAALHLTTATNASKSGLATAPPPTQKSKRRNRHRSSLLLRDLPPSHTLSFRPPPPPPLSLITHCVRPTVPAAKLLKEETASALDLWVAVALDPAAESDMLTPDGRQAKDQLPRASVSLPAYCAVLDRWYERTRAAESDYLQRTPACGTVEENGMMQIVVAAAPPCRSAYMDETVFGALLQQHRSHPLPQNNSSSNHNGVAGPGAEELGKAPSIDSEKITSFLASLQGWVTAVEDWWQKQIRPHTLGVRQLVPAGSNRLRMTFDNLCNRHFGKPISLPSVPESVPLHSSLQAKLGLPICYSPNVMPQQLHPPYISVGSHTDNPIGPTVSQHVCNNPYPHQSVARQGRPSTQGTVQYDQYNSHVLLTRAITDDAFLQGKGDHEKRRGAPPLCTRPRR